nr:tripartite tricarboxylate transporter substrate-binding protein [Noviherbaspirillum aerium]
MLAPVAAAAPFDRTECIAGAKAGGGFDLTCRLAQTALLEAGIIQEPMRITYVPGGIGAVAYNTLAGQRSSEPNTIVAFSSGSLLNLAQGKFGKYSASDVRWLAVVGADYGVIAVRKDSPYKSMKDLVDALKADSSKIVFGAGGTVGSQDWMKAAMTAKAAGVSHKAMRFVAFEGGGESLKALQGGHVHVYTGDASEAAAQIRAGANIRLLAVLTDKRLPGVLSSVPTALEQGYEVEWVTARGFYMGPKVSDADFGAWTNAIGKLVQTPEFSALRDRHGLYPMGLVGTELDAYVKKCIQQYQKMALEFGIAARSR